MTGARVFPSSSEAPGDPLTAALIEIDMQEGTIARLRDENALLRRRLDLASLGRKLCPGATLRATADHLETEELVDHYEPLVSLPGDGGALTFVDWLRWYAGENDSARGIRA